MKTRANIILSLLLISMIVSMALSQKVATTSMQFLKVMPCARATGLGEAYSAWASGAEAVFWNPSGVALTDHQEFSFTNITWIFDAKQSALGYALPLGNFGTIGLQVQYNDYGKFEEAVLTRPDIKEIPEPGLTGRQFSAYSYVAGITYARNLTDRFATGITFKYAHESLFDQNNLTVVDENGRVRNVNTYGDAYLFDFGIHYNTGFRSVQVAASVQNFGPSIIYAVEKNAAPMLFRVGVAADLIGPTSLLLSQDDTRLGLIFDLFQPNDYAQQAHVGMEFEYAHFVALRIGYKYNYDTEGLTFGCGLQQTFSGIKLSFDYSYGLTTLVVGGAHRISLGVGIL